MPNHDPLPPLPPPPPQPPQVLMDELSCHHHHHNHHSSVDIELHNELGFNVDNPYNTTSGHNDNINDSHFLSYEHPTNLDNSIHGVHDQMQQQFPDGTTSATSTPCPQPPAFLNLFSLPRHSPSTLLQNSSTTFTNAVPKTSNFPSTLGFLRDLPSAVDTPQGTASSVLYDPLLHLNLPPQPPLFRELLQSLPHGCTLPGSGNGSLFSSGRDEREGSGGGIYPDDGTITESFFEDGVMEFSREMGSIGRGRNLKESKNLAINRGRRQQLNDKFFTLRNLNPNPTKV